MNGAIWYREDTKQYRGQKDSSPQNIQLGAVDANFSSFVDERYVPSYTSANVVTFPSGMAAMDKTGSFLIQLTSSVACSLLLSGAGGLDTGAKTISTHYAAYLVGDSTGVLPGTVVWSTQFNQATGPTLPTGYNVYRRLNYNFTTDASGNGIPTYVASGWPHRPKLILFRDDSTYLVVENFKTTSWTTQNTPTKWVPPISRLVDMDFSSGSVLAGSAQTSHFVRETGSGLTTGRFIYVNSPSNAANSPNTDISLNANQQFDLISDNTNNGVSVRLHGYTITEAA
jgi:hypothetical protein